MRFSRTALGGVLFGIGVLGLAALPGLASEALVLEEDVIPHPGLDTLYGQFHEGYATLDAPLVAALYTEDALYLSPQQDIRRGRTAIAKSFTSMFDRAAQRYERLEIVFRIIRRYATTRVVSDVGYYTLSRSVEGAESRTDTGKFVTVGVLDHDGVWRFSVDGYSATEPWEREKKPAPTGE